MNRLIIIGNGFDMAHGLKTSYKDFINWYCDQRIQALDKVFTNVSEDCLFELRIKDPLYNWNQIFNSKRKLFQKLTGIEAIQDLKKDPQYFSIKYSPFFETILQSIDTKGWVDIENDYYQLLTRNIEDPRCDYTIEELNEQLALLQQKLIEYLNAISIDKEKQDILDNIIEFFDPADFAIGSKKKAMDYLGLDRNISSIKEIHDPKVKIDKLIPQRFMLLSFNYTKTARLYAIDNRFECNYIHGQLEDPEHIIFGYGDEHDKNFQHILDMNDDRYLKNIKSIRYLETGHYRKLQEFLMAAPFQVFIMGHSCGNSDRTLLNTIFEHENCISIKPFYHKGEDGKDNYIELSQNLARNFTNMQSYHDRVVTKERCLSF